MLSLEGEYLYNVAAGLGFVAYLMTNVLWLRLLLVQLIRFGSINDFLKRYGDLGENEFSKDGITIPQRLLMLNGNMLREAGEPNPVLNATGHINLFASSGEDAVRVMYLCLLTQ